MPAGRPIIFSDLDGTLVHFPKEFSFGERLAAPGLYHHGPSGAVRVCATLPNSTLGRGIVSQRSFELIAELRARGALFVEITGARKSTLLDRYAHLPPADVYVCENGGRIYRPRTPHPPTAVQATTGADALDLDTSWAARFEAITGPIETDTPALDRRGVLWDLARELHADGFVLDIRSYFANFRLDIEKSAAKRGRPSDECRKRLAEIFAAYASRGITCTSNLGKHDFHPTVTGKGNACLYLMDLLGADPGRSFSMFDDDNDLPMAAATAHCLLPTVRTRLVRAEAEAHPSWFVATKPGVLGTEQVLEEILRRITASSKL